MSSWGLVVTMLLALAGCYQGRQGHVQIAPLPPSLSPAERVAAYRAYAPHPDVSAIEWSCRGSNCSSEEVLVLGNGAMVKHLEDVVPLLPPDSASARDARRQAQLGTRGRRLLYLGFLAVVGGGLTVAKGFEDDSRATKAIGIVVIGIGFVSWGYTIATEIEYRRARKRVRASYAGDLAMRLNVCTVGVAIVPCEDKARGYTPPVVRDPALDELPQR